VQWVLTATAILLSLAVFIGHTDTVHTLTGPPPLVGDAPAYDSLAWELSQGRGFEIDWSDGEFRRPYLSGETRPPEWFARATRHGPTATRPPLVPYLMAGLNRCFGRQFWSFRLLNMTATAIAVGLVVWTVCDLAGPVPALLAAFNFVIVDWRTRAYAREILTESASLLLVAVLTTALLALVRRPRSSLAGLCGLVTGLAILARTMFVLWLPGLVIVVLCAGGASRGAWHSTASLRRAAAFLLVAGVLLTPWSLRNCRLLGKTLPLGTQGDMELAAGYSDEAFRRGGMWFSLEDSGFFPPDVQQRTGLDRELAAADFSRAAARDWALRQPHKLLPLAAMKIVQEFRPHGPGDLYVLVFAVLGLLLLRGRSDGRVLTAVVVLNAFAIALTWSTSGRFVVPILSVLHITAALGLWAGFLTVTSRRSETLALTQVQTD
jgi:4-amino-4-deoxy-L-arabinose transferase-like glycosyltransferase